MLVRDQTLELASIDYWLSHAAACLSIAGNKWNLLATVPGIVEELWTLYNNEFTKIREHNWSRDAGDHEIQTLARRISNRLQRLFYSPAVEFFVWVALLRATKVLLCVRDGPYTYNEHELFEDDILIYLT